VVALCLRSENAIIGPAVLRLLAFFVSAWMCHIELAVSRPDATHLTEFYLWISVGGVLGGVFNVIIAPIAFDSLIEYPIALAVAFALRPATSKQSTSRDRTGDVLFPAIVAAIIWLVYRSPAPPDEWFTNGPLLFMLVMMFVVFFFWKRPIRLALGALALYTMTLSAALDSADIIHQDRSFFGTYRIRAVDDFHVLYHGTTTHGAQNQTTANRTEPLAYYNRGGPLSDVFEHFALKPVRRVAIIGLGTGAIACYGRTGEPWTFFEIDPAIVEIARSPHLFSYLRDCPPSTDIVIGDARLKIAAAPNAEFDLIIIDAFSSDAVPAHLITREAVALYLQKLAGDGALVFHISNRFMDLKPVLSALAHDAGLAGAVGERFPDSAGAARRHEGSTWVAMTRVTQSIAPLLELDGWRSLVDVPRARLWTDDYTDVLAAIRWANQ
jgi:spermidine synthase